MSEKLKVYNGYEEKYMTGKEIKNYFKGCYETFGQHHSQISSYQIDLNKYRRNIKDDVLYRLFINDNFCRIMDSKTDAQECFFGYTKEKPSWAKN